MEQYSLKKRPMKYRIAGSIRIISAIVLILVWFEEIELLKTHNFFTSVVLVIFFTAYIFSGEYQRSYLIKCGWYKDNIDNDNFLD